MLSYDSDLTRTCWLRTYTSNHDNRDATVVELGLLYDRHDKYGSKCVDVDDLEINRAGDSVRVRKNTTRVCSSNLIKTVDRLDTQYSTCSWIQHCFLGDVGSSLPSRKVRCQLLIVLQLTLICNSISSVQLTAEGLSEIILTEIAKSQG